jgi:hypothetical protein
MERLNTGMDASATLHNKLIVGIVLQVIFALPIAVLSFYLIFKKGHLNKK